MLNIVFSYNICIGCFLQIRDLHVAKQVEDIGFYAGFVGEFFSKSSVLYQSSGALESSCVSILRCDGYTLTSSTMINLRRLNLLLLKALHI